MALKRKLSSSSNVKNNVYLKTCVNLVANSFELIQHFFLSN